MVDQDPAHHLCGHGDELGAVLPLILWRAAQLQIDFVNEGCRLEGVIGALGGKEPGSEAP